MFLQEFLNRCADLESLKQDPLICFSYSSPDLPVIFASDFIAHLKNNNFQIKSLELEAISLSQVIAQLETSFLGMSLTYWLRGWQELDKKK